jgi:hypothetical protein
MRTLILKRLSSTLAGLAVVAIGSSSLAAKQRTTRDGKPIRARAMQASPNIPTYPSTYAYPSSPSPTPNPAEACLKDVCGEAKDSKNLISDFYGEMINLIVSTHQNSTAKDYPPEITKLIGEMKTRADEQTQLLLKRVSEFPGGDDKPIVGIAQAIANAGVISPLFGKAVYKLNEKTNTYEVDEPKTREAWAKYPKADQDWALRALNHALKTQASGGLSDDMIQSTDIKLLYRLANKDLTFNQSVQTEFTKLVANYRKIENASDLEKAMYLDGATGAEIMALGPKIKNGSLSENEARKILALNESFSSTYAAFGDSKSPYYERPAPTLNQILKEGGGDTALVKKLLTQISESEMKDAAKLESCKTIYALNKRVLPTQTQIEALRTETENVKKDFRVWIAANTKTPEKEALLKEIDAVQFQMPLSKDEFEKAFAQRLRDEIADSKTNADAYMKIAPRDLKSLVSLVFKQDDEEEESKDKKPERNEYCDQFKYSPLSDATLTSFGHVMLSVSSASANPSTRRTIVAHEVGHNLMKAMSSVENKSAIVAIASCLSKLRTVGGKADETYTQGEDFADAVAIATARGTVKQNPWCVLLDRNTMNTAYTEGDLATGPKDPHSSGTFRTLHFEYLLKGQLPDSCNKFVEASNVKFVGRQCVKPLDAPASGATQTSGPARAIQSIETE